MLDTKSRAGYKRCAQYLDQLDLAARALSLEPAPRAYRGEFTINYRALFPDEARNYRVDVLEASAEQYASIWVNGDRFHFSAEAMMYAEALQLAVFLQLKSCLDRWGSDSKPSRSELQSALMAVDSAWASFEHKYISELISIEEKARQFVVDAIQYEQRLTHWEAQFANDEGLLDYRSMAKREVCNLVGSLAKLNSIANVR